MVAFGFSSIANAELLDKKKLIETKIVKKKTAVSGHSGNNHLISFQKNDSFIGGLVFSEKKDEPCHVELRAYSWDGKRMINGKSGVTKKDKELNGCKNEKSGSDKYIGDHDKQWAY